MQATLGQAWERNVAQLGDLFFWLFPPVTKYCFSSHNSLPNGDLAVEVAARTLCHGAGSSIEPSEKWHPQD